MEDLFNKDGSLVDNVNQDSINAVQAAVNKLPAGATKGALQAKINKAQQLLNEKKAKEMKANEVSKMSISKCATNTSDFTNVSYLASLLATSGAALIIFLKKRQALK